jgi:hypothetical protein
MIKHMSAHITSGKYHISISSVFVDEKSLLGGLELPNDNKNKEDEE